MNQQGVKVIILVFDKLDLILSIMVASLSSGVKGISVCMYELKPRRYQCWGRSWLL